MRHQAPLPPFGRISPALSAGPLLDERSDGLVLSWYAPRAGIFSACERPASLKCAVTCVGYGHGRPLTQCQ